ncbi:MAG: quinol:cytochrome C oxidoreductase [Bacteroidia bacterium]
MDTTISNTKYEFTSRAKMVCFILMAIGIASIVAQFATGYEQVWANLLQINFFFMAMGLCATFFVAFQYVARAGWSVNIIRVPEAMMTWLWIAMPLMLIIIVGGGTHIYHWMHEGITEKMINGNPNPEYDSIIAGKSAYLNKPFFYSRLVAYLLIWCGAAFYLRKFSIAEDTEGGTTNYFKATKIAIFFIVLFAVTSSTAAWDIMMSIDVHWFSTMYGWYTFAGMFITALTAMALWLVYLKSKGYMEEVTESHLQDVGKFMFAFSIFWTYLWFAQFMLQWYANLPEEIVYYRTRFDYYRWPFWIAFFLNFIFPFLILMTRDAKRKFFVIIFAGTIILIGHWLDNFLMVIPGVLINHGSHDWHIGIYEIGTTLGFAGGFMYMVHSKLASAPLLRKNHPMLVESMHHAI